MRRNEAGLTLIEVLVAVTVLAVATLVALNLYDAARDAYKVGQNVTEQQQTVRIAFDLMTGDLRMAGFNTNPDGERTRPDEQIEGAFANAVVIRADFDAEDPAAATDPETALSAGAFFTVSTGNDEIRAYALEKPDGSSAEAIEFEADVTPAARDGVVEPVEVSGLALTQDAPPYTLYRYSLSNDPSAYGDAGFVHKTVMAENVRSLRFRYFDQAGEEIPPPGGAETESAIGERRSIQSIRVELEVLTRDPDPDWVDLVDTDPGTRHFRKFLLAGQVTPRNLRRRGLRDLVADTTPPMAPGQPEAYPGHCGGLYIDWPPCTDHDVLFYRILVGTDPFLTGEQRFSDRPGYYFDGLEDGTTYHVTIQAVDDSGNASDLSPGRLRTAANTTTPRAPDNLLGVVPTPGEVELSWNAVTRNEEITPGDPGVDLIRDLAGYNVYRSGTSGFSPSPATLLASAAQVPAAAAPVFVDDTVVNCELYHYKVRAVDECGVEGTASLEVSARSVSDIKPKRPVGAAILPEASATRLTWEPVDRDVEENPIEIEEYRVFRSGLLPLGAVPVDAEFGFHATVTGATEYLDPEVPPAGAAYWYRVTARDRCPNESDPSDMVGPCSFEGNVVIEEPLDGAYITTGQFIGVRVQGATGYYPARRLIFIPEDGSPPATVDSTHDGPYWGYWLEPMLSDGWYTLRTDVDQEIAPGQVCTESASIRVYVYNL